MSHSSSSETLLGDAQSIIDSGQDERVIVEQLDSLFQPLTDLEKYIFASFVSYALKIKFEHQT